MTIRINREKKELRLSVRDLAFMGVMAQGRSYLSLKNAEAGKEYHHQIQQQKLNSEKAFEIEYYVKHRFEIDDWQIILRGRVDSLYKTPEKIVIEEIKSVNFRNFTGSPDDPRLFGYKNQLLCYAWMFFQKDDTLINIELALITLNRYDNKQYVILFPYEDMFEFIKDRIKQIVCYEEEKAQLYEQKVRSLENLKFPFPFRPFQEKIIQQIHDCITQRLNLIIEAPSGLGKTVVSVYPLLREVIEKKGKLFFITAKTTQKTIVEKTLEIFQNQGVNFLSITLKAKEKMCTNAFYYCHEDYCPFLQNHIKNPPKDYIQFFVQKRGVIYPELIEEEALNTHAFCPFELALDISLEADIILGDYNYVFHPSISLQRYFSRPPSKINQFYLIIDEAHNLIDRSRDYYSHSLGRKEVLDFKQAIRKLRRRIPTIPLPDSIPINLERIFRRIQADIDPGVSIHHLKRIDILSFQKNFTQFEESLREYLNFLMDKELHWPADPLLDFYYLFRDFVNTALLAQDAEEFSILYNSNEGSIKIFCKDASHFLNQRIKRFFRSVIAISATITPFPFYRDLLGFPVEKTIYAKFPSPFPPERRKVLVIPDIDTRYQNREHSYQQIAQLVMDLCLIKPGKYFVFFPSFKYADEVSKYLQENTEFKIIKQAQYMQEEERFEFLRLIEENPYMIAVGVTAGIFAEGIDLPGLLDGVFIISPSLPSFNFEQELIRQYYEERFGSGFNYAYQFPGLTRTFQAAGRLIRDSNDRGIIVFIGRRFSTPKYADYFPEYYYQNSPSELISTNPKLDIKLFWDSIK